jgi:hypothetical protein
VLACDVERARLLAEKNKLEGLDEAALELDDPTLLDAMAANAAASSAAGAKDPGVRLAEIYERLEEVRSLVFVCVCGLKLNGALSLSLSLSLSLFAD